jgi:NitT/TauT family transport system substrate-binding protein
MSWKSLFASVLCTVISIANLAGESFPAEKARMGYLQSDLHQLAGFIALEKGFYKEEGIHVVVEGIFKAGPELMSAFASKDLDFGYVGEAPVTVAVAHKVANVKIIAQANLEGSAIVIFKGSGIKSIKDLVGKTVAVPGYATVQDFLLRKALSDNHIPVKAVNVIIIKPPEMIPALRTKQIDAFVAWEPYPSKAVTSGVGEVFIPSRKIWPRHPCCVLVADSQFIEKNPQIIMGILRAHVKATKLIRENPKEALNIGVKYTGMESETIELAMRNIYYEYIPDVQGELDYVTFLQELGQIKDVEPKNFVNDIIRTDLLDKIIMKK